MLFKLQQETTMAEPFDVYADQFLITLTPFGANLSFQAREAHPSPHAVPASTPLGTVRMSVEHLKVMVMMVRNQVKTMESQTGVKFDVPTDVLSQLKIAREDWDYFWK
jgi:hypothetical protein